MAKGKKKSDQKNKPANVSVDWIVDAFNSGDYSEMLRRAEIVDANSKQLKKLNAKVRHLRGLACVLLWRLDDALPLLESAATELETDADAWDHYGVTLNRSGFGQKAQECYQKVLKLAPARTDTLINAAKNAYDLEEYVDAEKYATAAITSMPNSAKAWGNLGNALRRQAKNRDAIQAYLKAIEIDPGYAEAYNNLGVLLHLKGDIEQAILAAEKSVELDPSDDANLNNLAIYHKQIGNLQRAEVLQKKALQGIIDRKYKKPVAPKEYMDIEIAHRALLTFRQAMCDLNVPFFLAYGTLLGIVRDGDLLPHDKDMDVGLPADVDREWLIDQLCSNYGFSRSSLPLPNKEIDHWNISVVHKETDITIDLFFFIPDGGDLISGIYHLPHPLYWRFSRFETSEIEYLGHAWQVPNPPERYLAEIYGSDWQVPDPYFDSLISGCNRNPESLDVAICFALNRLYDRMDRGEWKKALGYCRQILKYQEDGFIRYVEAWVGKQINEGLQ